MVRLVLVLVVVMLFACADKMDINGHWHAVVMHAGNNQTLDITDTLTISNRWSLVTDEQIECLRWHPDSIDIGQQHLPLVNWSSTTKIRCKNDTLIVGDGAQTFRYIRSDLHQCEIEDRYRNVSVQVVPPLAPVTGYFNYDPRFADIFIGKALEQKHSINPDSVQIEVVNIFIGLNEVKQYCSEIKSRLRKNTSPSILLHADKHVSEAFLQKVIAQIPNEFSIYQAVVAPDNSLAVIMRR